MEIKSVNIEIIFDILRKASEITENRETVSKVDTKGDKNFVTAADKAVQDFVQNELKAILPEAGFYAEEEDEHTATDSLRWILDPVDGTTNLMHDFPCYCISLALAEGEDPIFGAVYHIKSGDIFYAKAGEGAYKFTERSGKTEKLAVSDVKILSKALTGIGTSPYYKDIVNDNFRLYRAIFDNTCDIRRIGSAAMDCCYVAASYDDIFVESVLSPWDYAAGMLIITEAGGKITDFAGNKPSLNKPCSILATNGILHDEMLKLIQITVPNLCK